MLTSEQLYDHWYGYIAANSHLLTRYTERDTELFYARVVGAIMEDLIEYEHQHIAQIIKICQDQEKLLQTRPLREPWNEE